MAKRVWLFQTARDQKQLGDKAPWHVGWYQGSRRRSKKVGTKTAARQYRNRLEASLNTDQFSGPASTTWQDYRSEYETDVLSKLRPSGRTSARVGLDHYERLMKPKRLTDVTRQSIAAFSTKRLAEKHHGRLIARATVNRDLRQLRAFLREAVKRRYLAVPPTFTFLKEPKRIPTYVTPEVFALLYDACDAANAPTEQGYSAGDWWRAYLVFLFLTGWRAFEPLSVSKEDMDWDSGRIFLRAENTKGGRDELIPLHPVALEHLDRIRTFGAMLFPWSHGRRRLWDEFHVIQDAAGVRRRDGKYYGFHDLRRGFATLNATRMTTDALQRLMRHQSYATTQRYVAMADQLTQATENLFVPELPQRKGGGHA